VSRWLQACGRAYDGLVTGLAMLSGATIAAVCLLIAYDVIARNLGLQPPDSTVALTEYALLYLTMGAAPYLVRTRGHIVVEAVYAQLPPAARARLDRAILIACALIAFLVAGLAVSLMAEASARGEIDIRSLDMPRQWLFFPIAAGFTLMGTEFLRLLVRGESLFKPVAERQESF